MPTQTVLLVDDNAAVRSALRSFLEGRIEFSHIEEAANGADAIEKAKLIQPNVVLMDFSMPGINGIEASSVIKGSLPFTKIFLFTLHSGGVSTRVAKAAGIDVVVSKEQGLTGLKKALEDLLADKIPS